LKQILYLSRYLHPTKDELQAAQTHHYTGALLAIDFVLQGNNTQL